MAYKAQIKGLNDVLRKFDRIDKSVGDRIDKELTEAARTVESDAKARAPRHLGALVSSIRADTSGRFSKSVSVLESYGAYVEFGTGRFVFQGPYSFTASEQLYARKFYVSGKGRTKSQPYLFPAFHAEIPKLMTRLKQAIFA